MEDCGILSPSILLSHANMLSDKDISLIKLRGAHISSTPSIELQMGMGTPALFDRRQDIQSCCSIGIDCHNATVPSIPAEMRSALQSTRGRENQKFLEAGKLPAKVSTTVQEVYAKGTIQGARAIGMEDRIGSLAVGKLADIIVFDGLSPNMICGAQFDPVTAIVMHSTPGDITMTIVDGIIRKKNGQFEPLQMDQNAQKLAGAQTPQLQWSDVVKPLLASRDKIQRKIDKTDLHTAKQDAMKVFGYDESLIVDSI